MQGKQFKGKSHIFGDLATLSHECLKLHAVKYWGDSIMIRRQREDSVESLANLRLGHNVMLLTADNDSMKL
jgi:hypothetical protein